MQLAADARSGTMTTSTDPGDEMAMVRVRHRFPAGTLVVPGQGRFQNEIWMLVGGECTKHWNYWIVLVNIDALGDWVIERTVPWWGPYYRDWHERQLARSNPPRKTSSLAKVQHARRSNPPNA